MAIPFIITRGVFSAYEIFIKISHHLSPKDLSNSARKLFKSSNTSCLCLNHVLKVQGVIAIHLTIYRPQRRDYTCQDHSCLLMILYRFRMTFCFILLLKFGRLLL